MYSWMVPDSSITWHTLHFNVLISNKIEKRDMSGNWTGLPFFSSNKYHTFSGIDASALVSDHSLSCNRKRIVVIFFHFLTFSRFLFIPHRLCRYLSANVINIKANTTSTPYRMLRTTESSGYISISIA